ncbi:hypothetical protein BDZ89DRAFT_720776 [Hymenopellis radicata]|nr:hypothetical protein BDZ89DRAFT_720776 [Hymenopellis radicata]
MHLSGIHIIPLIVAFRFSYERILRFTRSILMSTSRPDGFRSRRRMIIVLIESGFVYFVFWGVVESFRYFPSVGGPVILSFLRSTVLNSVGNQIAYILLRSSSSCNGSKQRLLLKCMRSRLRSVAEASGSLSATLSVQALGSIDP